MLLSKKIKVDICPRNFKYFKEKGYIFNKVGDIIEIDVVHLTKGSHSLVEVSCDYCGKNLNIPYKRYIKYTSVYNKYSCSNKDCSNKKIKDVCLKKFGVENPFQSNFVKAKSKKTFNEKYGVNHQMELQETKDKIKNTCLKKYGVVHPMNLQETKDKIKNTCLKKYGVDHDNKLSIQKEKRKLTRIKKGNQLPDNLIEPYILYRRNVDNISDKLKKELIKNWNGYDYYDNEYIFNNFNLKSSDKNYPTIDHKISVIYGFINNISIENISNINNLCFTKNYLNAKKGGMVENEFKNKITNQDPVLHYHQQQSV